MLRKINQWIVTRLVYAKTLPGLLFYFYDDSKSKLEKIEILLAPIVLLVGALIITSAIMPWQSLYDANMLYIILVQLFIYALVSIIFASYIAEHFVIKLSNKEVNILRKTLNKLPFKESMLKDENKILYIMYDNVFHRMYDSADRLNDMELRAGIKQLAKKIHKEAKHIILDNEKVNKEMFLTYYANILDILGKIYYIDIKDNASINLKKYIAYQFIAYFTFIHGMVSEFILKYLNKPIIRHEI